MTYHPPQCTEIEPGGHEDCTWCSGVMLQNAAYGAAVVPSTRSEYESLRVAGGDGPAENPGDGSNLSQMATGMRSRYGWAPPVLVPSTSTALWAQLDPGVACVVQGRMGSIPSHWRRWDPGFSGAHAVLVVRDDAAERVWWMNPQAPSSYSGELMPRGTLEAYWKGLPGARISPIVVGSRTQEDPMNPLPITDATPKIVDPIEGRRLFKPDLTPSVVVSNASGVASPFGSKIGTVNYRAIYITTGGVRQLLLVKNGDCSSIANVPDMDAARVATIKAKTAAFNADIQND